MPLEVHIADPAASGSGRTLRFSKSPVRIGRNQLNDISLQDPFVSEWHGTIRFDDRSVAYFDLGSTNGSIVDGERLTKNVPAVLARDSKLQLGRLTFTISHERAESLPSKTIGWDPAAPSPKSPGSEVRGPVVRSAGNEPSASRTMTRLGISDAASLGASAPPVAAPAPPSGRPALVAAEPAPRTDASLPKSVAADARYAALLDVFSEAFVGLRKGYEQFGSEVGIRIVNGTTPLHRARTSREVTDYLLTPDADPQVLTRDLNGIFADFAIHHIALMEGITEGVRALLQSLDPRANDLETSPRLLASSKKKLQWKGYLERFDQMLTEDEALHGAIFGEEFARAYASVTLGTDDPGDPEDSR